MMLSRALLTREGIQLQQRTDAEAKHVAAQLKSAVLQSVDVLPQMGKWWVSQGRPVAREDWISDAEIFMKSETSMREVVWLDNRGKVSWCVRPGAVPDFNCRAAEPELTALVRQAAASGSVALSPVVIREGVPRIYACTPVRRAQRMEFIAGAFDASTLIQSLLKEQAPRDYELAIRANDQAVATSKHGAGPLWSEGTRRAEVKIANRWWSVQLTPTATDIQMLQRGVWGFGIIVAILIFVCSGLALIYKRSASALRAEVVERRRAEDTIADLNRDLRYQVDDFKTLLEVLPVGIAVSNDPNCLDIQMNLEMAAMLRMPINQNISQSGPNAERLPYRLFRNGAEVPAEELPMQIVARTGKSVLDVDLDIVRNDGSVVNTCSYSAPVFDQKGKLRHIIHACVDITERKRSERERKALEEGLLRAEKDRSLGLMAAGVAHDFNNLLTAIIGNSELARCELPLLSPARQPIGEALAAANRAAELAAQLLAYTGRSWFELKPLDLSAQVRAMSESIRAMAPQQVEIRFDLDADLPVITAGTREVQDVLRHLVANAAEAIGEGRGAIQVRTAVHTLGPADLARDYPDQELVPGTYVRLEVSDNGGGVPTELAARVFDPFFTTKFLGRGLGLSAVQGIMRAHHGGVRFDTLPGRGACVQAIFPATAAGQMRNRVA